MAKRFHETDVWSQDWFIEMPVEYRVLWFWILDKCDHAGIWKPNKKIFEVINQMEVDLDKALEYFNSGKERIMLSTKGNWFMVDFFVFQYGTVFNHANRVHESIYKALNQELIDISNIRGLIEVKMRSNSPQLEDTEGVKDKDKDKDKDNNKKGVENFSKNGNDEKQRIDLFRQDLLADRYTIEKTCINTRIDESKLLQGLEIFITTKISSKESLEWKTDKDFRRNFIFWIPSWIEREKKEMKKNGVAQKTKQAIDD